MRDHNQLWPRDSDCQARCASIVFHFSILVSLHGCGVFSVVQAARQLPDATKDKKPPSLPITFAVDDVPCVGSLLFSICPTYYCLSRTGLERSEPHHQSSIPRQWDDFF